jgi:LysM repeat protein
MNVVHQYFTKTIVPCKASRAIYCIWHNILIVNYKEPIMEENIENTNPTNNAEALGALASAAGSTGDILSEYTVEERDTLSEIGRKHGLSWNEIYEANKDVIKDPDMIQPGWKLKIPNKKTQ